MHAVQCFYRPDPNVRGIRAFAVPTDQRIFEPTYPVRPSSLGDNLRKKRIDLRISQGEVAERLGADQDTVWNWENNRSSPSLRFVPLIIEFLGYAPDDSRDDDLGKRIIACRRRQGLRQEDLATKLGVDPSTVGRWEHGISRPSRKLAERLEGFLRG